MTWNNQLFNFLFLFRYFDPQILKDPPPPPDSNERISERMRTLSILFDAS